MQLHHRLIATLAATFTCADAFVQLFGDKMAAATFTDADTASSGTIIAYQYYDGSIHTLTGSGPPSANSYTSTEVLAANRARNDTPIAIIADYVDLANTIHLYYHSNIECPGGHELAEWYREATTGAWTDGALNQAHICASSESNFLYAVSAVKYANVDVTKYTNRIRVGYMAAVGGYLTEAYPGPQSIGNAWTTSQF